MSKTTHSRPYDIFSEFEELQFDKILKRLPDTITEATIDKSSHDDVLHLLISAKIIVVFGAFSTGNKLVELVQKRFTRMTSKELLGPFKKALIVLLGIMYDLRQYEAIHTYTLSLGNDVLKTLLETDSNFKSLWALVLMEKPRPDIQSARIVYDGIQQEKDLNPILNNYLIINFLYTLFEKGLKTPQEVLAFCDHFETDLQDEVPYGLYHLRAQAYKAMGDQPLAEKNAKQFLNQLSPNLVMLNFHSRVLLNEIKPSESIDTRVLLLMFPQLHKRVITKDLTEDANEDLYVIRGNELRITKYEDIEHERKESVLDLVSGFYRYKNRKTFLSKNRILAIKAIISMGPIGIKDILIGEYVFLDENVALNSVRKRSQDIVTQLQKIEIPVKRKDNTIFYDFENSPLTILIGAQEIRGEIAYLKKKHKVINKKIVTYELMTKPSTSSLYLKKWREENKIVPTNDPYGDYRFS